MVWVHELQVTLQRVLGALRASQSFLATAEFFPQSLVFFLELLLLGCHVTLPVVAVAEPSQQRAVGALQSPQPLSIRSSIRTMLLQLLLHNAAQELAALWHCLLYR